MAKSLNKDKSRFKRPKRPCPDFMVRIPPDEEVFLSGKDFNLCISEDTENRILHFSIVVKDAALLDRMHLGSKLDLHGDKSFATYSVRAIGKRDWTNKSSGGLSIVSDDPNQVEQD